MRVYLVQHGVPVPEEVNPQKPLSEQGREDVKRIARFLSRAGIRPSVVLHSGKLRAKETAEILAEELKPEDSIHQTDGLNPLDEPAIWKDRLHQYEKDVMLVGHLPHLQRLLSSLITGDPDRRVVQFRQAAVVALIKDDEGWAVRWMVSPEII